MPLSAPEAGHLAAAVVFYLRQEADAQKLAREGGGAPAEELARKAGADAERTFARVQELQAALSELALASVTVDRDALVATAGNAAEEIRELKKAMEAAHAELAGGEKPPALGSGGAEGGGN